MNIDPVQKRDIPTHRRQRSRGRQRSIGPRINKEKLPNKAHCRIYPSRLGHVTQPFFDLGTHESTDLKNPSSSGMSSASSWMLIIAVNAKRRIAG
ncbi:MAG: hypothetical protein ACRELS_13435 [Candidatus Rokuibacteriota bacterium]